MSPDITVLMLSEVSQHFEHEWVVRGEGLNRDYRKSAPDAYRDWRAAERRMDGASKRGDRAGWLIASGQARHFFDEWCRAEDLGL